MAEFEFETVEIRSLERDIEVATPTARKFVRDTVRKGIFEIEARGKVNSPYRTGNLRNSITSDFIGSNRDVAQGETGPEAGYGWFVEGGTERMAPQPYMGPAFDAVEPSIIEALESIDPFEGT
ncbi:HK97-gp10 family putative phage morphogenesis protein [Glycomyces tenuis]|uniref:HK97-gp10 family putative phage morphogenesis protein n=1 Tax=Glycomyces tenuis TaxID=58116 RepID=UPI00040FD27B|nr:HK97-gp10 family putative phage morphogenesis protein [Glycomyces tenuis]